MKYSIENQEYIEIKLIYTKSKIVQENNYTIYCFLYKGLRGLFRKDIQSSLLFGRKICDAVKYATNTNGFFTTDELPRYGLTNAEKKQILSICKAEKTDLVVMCAYPLSVALEINNTLFTLMSEL